MLCPIDYPQCTCMLNQTYKIETAQYSSRGKNKYVEVNFSFYGINIYGNSGYPIWRILLQEPEFLVISWGAEPEVTSSQFSILPVLQFLIELNRTSQSCVLRASPSFVGVRFGWGAKVWRSTVHTHRQGISGGRGG